MSIAVVLAGAIMAVTADGLVLSQLLQPFFVIRVQPSFITVDQNNTTAVQWNDCQLS